ncbi:unknown protein [Microcystis aeruginosa NIES-843]|uniref:Uncharacterized protein n=2 Tax=Microcystis TaxID=1125 RepID=B0JH50_MICAN|nr:hypothetical protein VL20_3929 [Microcystis panniformis FACHB-1757]BAG02202.1 unknown protein [Microcystis aeruginosa NIES-843]
MIITAIEFLLKGFFCYRWHSIFLGGLIAGNSSYNSIAIGLAVLVIYIGFSE